jgi:hypothetical protein
VEGIPSRRAKRRVRLKVTRGHSLALSESGLVAARGIPQPELRKQPPTPANPGQDAEDGRGLLLVQALSLQWGYFLASTSSGGHAGKVVLAIVGVKRPCPPSAAKRARYP